MMRFCIIYNSRKSYFRYNIFLIGNMMNFGRGAKSGFKSGKGFFKG